MKQCTQCKEYKNIEDFYLNYGKIRPHCKICHRKHKEEYKLGNREKYLEQRRDYYQRKKNNPIFALSKRLRQGIYRSLRGIKLRSSLDILGCTQEEFKLHIESQFTDEMCWDRLSEIHIDHIIPISSAESIEDVYKLNHYTNLQPLWARDNIQKYNKILT